MWRCKNVSPKLHTGFSDLSLTDVYDAEIGDLTELQNLEFKVCFLPAVIFCTNKQLFWIKPEAGCFEDFLRC